MRKRQFRKGDMVEWTETHIDYHQSSCFVFPYPFPYHFPRGMYPNTVSKEKHTGVIIHVPKNLETGFITIKDDEDGAVHIMDKTKIKHLKVKVMFD